MEDVTLSFEVHQAAQVSLTFKWVVRRAGLSGAQGGWWEPLFLAVIYV